MLVSTPSSSAQALQGNQGMPHNFQNTQAHLSGSTPPARIHIIDDTLNNNVRLGTYASQLS